MNRKTRAKEIPVGKKILCLEFSPFLWCPNLLAVASEDTIGIYDVCFPEDNLTAYPRSHTLLHEWPIGEIYYCRIISFSPIRQLPGSTRTVSLACADPSKSIFRYYGYYNESWVEYDLHQSAVNDIAVEPITGDVIASVGDDKAIVSSLEDKVMAEFNLKSPGISVSWHKSEEGKIIVGEKNGLITLYDFMKETAERSFDCHVFPLRCLKWCPSNSIRIGGVTDDKWFIWNIDTSQVVEEGELPNKAASFRFSNIDENIYTVRSAAGSEIAVIHRNFTNVDCDDLPEGNAISFHSLRNFFAVDGDETVFIVKVCNN